MKDGVVTRQPFLYELEDVILLYSWEKKNEYYNKMKFWRHFSASCELLCNVNIEGSKWKLQKWRKSVFWLWNVIEICDGFLFRVSRNDKIKSTENLILTKILKSILKSLWYTKIFKYLLIHLCPKLYCKF